MCQTQVSPPASFNRRRRSRFSGLAVVYILILMTAMIAFTSLAVDLGRAQLAKTELHRAADAAAIYGAQGFATSTVLANAITAAAENNVDGTPLILQNSDVQIGVWHNGQFKPNGSGISAVQINAKRIKSRNTAVPLLFAAVIGQHTLDINASSVATYVAPVNVSVSAQAKANPWLAGMPAGTTANGYDSAPNDSPSQVTGLPITPGGKLNFSFNGGVSYLPGTGNNGPDGDLSFILYNGIYTGFNGGREHGMSNLTAPITAVVGVFLDNNQPDTEGAPPPDLDFTTDASRDFTSLSPQLRQPFFIGDGLTSSGAPQDFVVPAGATRLFIGVMDGQQWSDNTGSFTTTISYPAQITLVQ
jgi:Flp pilus assembly protein TadG